MESEKNCEHESDNYTKCNWCSWYSQRRTGTRTGGLGNKKTSGIHLNNSVMEYATEREKGRSIPLPSFYLNQQALRLTVKMLWKRRSSYPHSVTCSLLNGRSLGQSSWHDLTWWWKWEKSNDWPTDTSRQNAIREIWRRIFSFGQKSARETRWSPPTPGTSLTRKKKREREREIWTLKTRQRWIT